MLSAMAALEVCLTMAVPVNVAKLGAHFEAYLETLPGLNALRACNRFGTGPQCHINKLPVELIQRISDFHIVPAREEKFEEWNSLLRCYEDDCEYDCGPDYTREELLEMYHANHNYYAPTYRWPVIPDDEQLYDFVARHLPEQSEIHFDREQEWEWKVEHLLSDKRPLFRKHFGLDVWLSKVHLGASSEHRRSLNTTVTYLILPNRATFDPAVERDEDEHTYETGYGMTLAMDEHATPEEIQNFGRVMRILDLDVDVHYSQVQWRTLSLAQRTKHAIPAIIGGESSAGSFPRPMLLVRSKLDAQW